MTYKQALSELIAYYRPSWHYQMGKVGYECSWCSAIIRYESDFDDPDQHSPDCEFIKAKLTLDNSHAIGYNETGVR